MKASNYNYIIYQNNQSYWYNGLEHTYFKLPKDLGLKIERLLTDKERIEFIPKVLKDKLSASGFIVPDNTDELSIIRKRYCDSVNKKNYLLIILPTLDCNFKCWYCIQNHIPSRMSKSTMENVMTHIKYMIDVQNIESLQIEWFGGEPLMYLKQIIKPICEFAQKECEKKGVKYSTTATSNGYFIFPKNIPLIQKLGMTRFHITLDGPKQNHDKVKYQKGCDSAFDHVLNNINQLLSNTKAVNILLRINYTDENLNYEIVDQINHHITMANRGRITITPKKVWQEKVRKDRYKDIGELLNLFEQSGYNTIRLDVITNFVPCYASRKYYNAINFNGDVIKCTACNDLYENKTHGIIQNDGSISWNMDFIRKYEVKSFENKRCLQCKQLPICMGVFPRDNEYVNACKFDGMDINLEDSMVNYIDSMCK